MKYGLNLYSLRTLIGSEEDFLKTALALKEMGYEYLQYSGGAFLPDRIKRVSEQSGLPVVLTHVEYEDIVNRTDEMMEAHAVFGCKNIGLGGLSQDVHRDRDKMLSVIDNLERAAEKMEQNGFRFFYHHHHYEFARHGEGTVMDYLLQNAPHVNITADTYWLQYGGVDVNKTLKKWQGKIGCVHLKDYRVDYGIDGAEKKMIPRFAPVGDGNLDFPELTSVMQGCGTQYYLVEQDNAVFAKDPLGEVKRSIEYLRRVLP